MDFLMHDLLWWHWIAFGLILVVAEIVVPLFVIIWFGLAAIMIGLLGLFVVIGFVSQFALWIVLSLLFLLLWFKYFQQDNHTESGQADFRFDTKGVVIETIPHGARGKVRFETPVLGSSEWQASSDETLTRGDIIRIVDVNGQLIKVKKDN